MRNTLIIILITILATVSLLAESNTDTFKKANDLYSDGKYSQALELYSQLEKNGIESADLYYNMGNCYYRLRKIPETILYFEKAAKLSPGDEDIDFNRNVAMLRTIDKIPPVPKFFLTEWLESFIGMMSSTGWAVSAVIFIWLAFLMLVGFMFIWSPAIKKILFAGAFMMIVLFGISTYLGYQSNQIENDNSGGVVFAVNVYVKSSPDENSTDLFILHEGAKVKVLDKVNEWLKIKLANGDVGWLPSDAIKSI